MAGQEQSVVATTIVGVECIELQEVVDVLGHNSSPFGLSRGKELRVVQLPRTG
jgi:hypothetical protein